MNKKPPFMHDNFEKEVQQKMEELHLTPSAPVWQKIELQIKPEERKKRVIFWMLLAGLLLGCGGWWVYQFARGNKKQASVYTSIDQKKQDTFYTDKKFNKLSVETNDTSNSKTSSLQTSTVIQQKKKLEKQQTIKHLPLKTEGTQKDKGNSVALIQVDKKASGKTISTLIPVEEKKSNNQLSGEDKIESTKVDEQKETLIINNTDIQTTSKQQGVFVNDSSVQLPIKKENVVPINIDSFAKKKIAKADGKWKKGLSLTTGWSSSAAAPFLTTRANDMFSQPAGAGAGPVAATYQPAATSGGYSFGIGVNLSKKLSRKWEVSFGLQYAQYVTHIKVGDKKIADTAINFGAEKVAIDAFYTNAGKNNYANRFHVLEVPVRITYQPLGKLPLLLSIGASYGRLLSTTALTYSSSSNLYYKNNEDYLRNFLPVQASVQCRFGSEKGLQFQTGPVLQYNLLKLQKGSPDNKHLIFAGLKTEISF